VCLIARVLIKLVVLLHIHSYLVTGFGDIHVPYHELELHCSNLLMRTNLSIHFQISCDTYLNSVHMFVLYVHGFMTAVCVVIDIVTVSAITVSSLCSQFID